MKMQFFKSAVLFFVVLTGELHAQMGNLNPTGPAGEFNGDVTTGGSGNFYDPFTGNLQRRSGSPDIVVAGGVGAYPLGFTRTLDTRYTAGLGTEFGKAGAWRHSYQWSIDPIVMTSSTHQYPKPGSYKVNYPDGRRVTFMRRNSNDPYFRGPAGVRDRLKQLPATGSQDVYLLLPDGGQVWFQAYVESVGDDQGPWTTTFDFYFMGIIDPHGQRTLVSYPADGSMTLTNPLGGLSSCSTKPSPTRMRAASGTSCWIESWPAMVAP